MNKLTNFNTIKVVKMPPKTLPVKTGSLQVNKEQTEADDGGIEVVGVDISWFFETTLSVEDGRNQRI